MSVFWTNAVQAKQVLLGHVQHVLLESISQYRAVPPAPIAARTRTRPLLALILFPLVKVVHQILNLETHQLH